jgi:hypothetical protein
MSIHLYSMTKVPVLIEGFVLKKNIALDVTSKDMFTMKKRTICHLS